MNNFDEWANYYDLMYREKIDEAEDLSFYKSVIDLYGEPALEMGCGTGRLYLEMREEGFDVHGLDISETMLKQLRRKGEERGIDVVTYNQDSRTFEIDRNFSVIYYPFSALMHIRGVKNQFAVFDRVHNHLANDGVFAFDIPVPDFEAVSNYGEINREEFIENGTTYISESWSELTNKVNQEMEMTQRLINSDTDEIVFETVFELTLIPKEQVDFLLDQVGFSTWDYYSDFDRSELEEDSERLVVVAKK